MKKFFLFAALLLSAAWLANAQDAKRYEIKSGIITMESDMGATTIYFDNYGAVEAQKMKMSMFGADTEMTILSKDGKTFMINAAEKQVQEMPAGGMGGATINFLKLDDKTKADYKIKEEGKEKILGRDCTKYSMEVSQMGQTVKQTVWVWKGIALKTSTDAGQFQFGNTATKIEENAAIPAGTFDVPKF